MEEARRRARKIMKQGKVCHTPSSTAEIQQCIMLVATGLVTEIEEIQLGDIDMSEVTSHEVSLLLGVVTRAVYLEYIKFSASQTEALFSSMSGLSGGISLTEGVEIDGAAATEGLRGITGRVRGEWIECLGDSSDKYRQGMEQWAGVLGWEYLNEGLYCKIQK